MAQDEIVFVVHIIKVHPMAQIWLHFLTPYVSLPLSPPMSYHGKT